MTLGKLVGFVDHSIRLLSESREADILSPLAALASKSAGRLVFEGDDPVRTCFQRDRDRILHSKAFRRLKHKTQVFIDPAGDHFRTRLTHTLEVSQIARSIGRALRLNEDLIEAIALGHDLGHPPFGHAGEEALDEAIQEHVTGHSSPVTRFRHYEQSLRIVDVLERLNLTEEARAGISGHSKGRGDLSDADGEATSTLEAAAVRVSDRIAYLSHDIDDATRAGLIDSPPAASLSFGKTSSERIGTMVTDVISNSTEKPAILLSPAVRASMNELKDWMFENVYLRYPELSPETRKAQNVVGELFAFYAQPENLPAGFEGVQGAIDYVAGMTDRFAIEDYARLKVPMGFR